MRLLVRQIIKTKLHLLIISAIAAMLLTGPLFSTVHAGKIKAEPEDIQKIIYRNRISIDIS